MTIRQFLHYFVSPKSDYREPPEDDPIPAVFLSPGMHQIIDEPDELALTPEDKQFLRHLGILQ